MDTLSHGLFGGVVFGRKNKFSYWKSFVFGVMPDLLSFGIFFVVALGTVVSDFSGGPPNPDSIPSYVYGLYDVTHSLVVAAVVIGGLWFIKKRLMIELLSWPLHILFDIPTHTKEFFPTPFLWPVSDFYIDGVSWSTPWVFFPYISVLIGVYLWFYLSRRRKRGV